MKFRWDKKYLHWGFTIFCVVAASMLFYFGIFHMATLKQGFDKVYSILTPIIYAAIISYILWPIIRFMEKTVIYRICNWKKWNPTRKVRK